MITQKDYCDYETCVALEEVGMLLKTQIVRSYAKEGIQTSKIYPNRPSLYEAQKWLREEKKLYVEVTIVVSGKNYMFEIYDTETAMLKRFVEEDYSTYEEALLEGIKEAIKILKEENND